MDELGCEDPIARKRDFFEDGDSEPGLQLMALESDQHSIALEPDQLLALVPFLSAASVVAVLVLAGVVSGSRRDKNQDEK